MATGLILAVGLFVLFVMGRGDRQRLSAMGEVTIGDPANRVTELLGVSPTACRAGPLDHLRESFPEGWTPASIDVALEQLAVETAERWVYPIEGAVAECGGVTSRTEVGVTQEGTVLWTVAVLGRSALELPPTLTPAGVEAEAATPPTDTLAPAPTGPVLTDTAAADSASGPPPGPGDTIFGPGDPPQAAPQGSPR